MEGQWLHINPGVQQYGAQQPVKSITQDAMTPVEYGRTAAASKYTVTASSGSEIGAVATGPATGVTLVGTTSVQADGAQTGVATTSSGGGTGAIVSYTVSSNVASGASLVAGGSGYAAGETLTVVGDTGVTLTVSI